MTEEERAAFRSFLLRRYVLSILALVLGIRVGLKPLLGALVGDAAWAGGVRYLLMTLVGGILWPMTFGFWGRLGRRREMA